MDSNLAKGKPVYKVTMLLDNTSSLLRLIIASVVSVLLFILLFASITYIKFVRSPSHPTPNQLLSANQCLFICQQQQQQRQLIHEDDEHEV
jgi:hypothetical protein